MLDRLRARGEARRTRDALYFQETAADQRRAEAHFRQQERWAHPELTESGRRERRADREAAG